MELNAKRGLLFGNEAIVRGALEAGVAFASSYPGTPASEIGEAFSKIAKETGLYFEWSTNEKVALEAAAGAAFSGLKSIVSMKHYGLNVALDSLLPLTYLSCPLVVAVADDPGCFSSVQTEQDSRNFASLVKIPIFEPSNPQEAKDMTIEAFKIAWRYNIPVLIRLVTRVSYCRAPVNFNKVKTKSNIGRFVKKEFDVSCNITVGLHKKLLKKLEKIKQETEKSKFNFIEKGEGKIGIITSGVAYEYVKEALEKLELKLPLLKIGTLWPFPSEKLKKFLQNLEEVVVVEELDPFVENEIKKVTRIRIYGKDFFSESGELKPEQVLVGLAKIFKKPLKKEITASGISVEPRLPFLCPGCPHRATFYAISKVLGKKHFFGGDIGCYLLAAKNPFKMSDYIVSMGAGVGISHGISKSTSEKSIAFIGDSTFFHAGLPALVNLVYNKANILVVILDNRWTAMTGHQPNPTTGINAVGEETKVIDVEQIARACKVDWVKTSNVYDFAQLCKDIKEAYDVKGVSVLVAKGECKLMFTREAAKKGIKLPKYEIIKQKPELEQLKEFDCPAIQKLKGKWIINKDLCWSCSVCKQLYPDCIKVKIEETQEKNERKGI
ncbi:MAG: indolepyruvate ferredoxin oxidoreductase subunit alpha [Candidatus Pacearchaeota archaeon]|nr:indolepyruvate ferredoxin oxidoreductase subunit alpha [Candidatus Pacearchaeota archaeon]